MTRRLLDLVSESPDAVSCSISRPPPSPHHPVSSLLLERAQGDCIQDLTHKEIATHLRVYRESVTTALGECAGPASSPSIANASASSIVHAWSVPPQSERHLLQAKRAHPEGGYSYLSASIGSTRTARRAGR